jgi:NTE family protein
LQANSRLKRIVVIVVNARTSDISTINKSRNPPGIFGVLKAAAGVPFDNYSNESLTRLEMLSTQRRADRIGAECYNKLLVTVHPGAPPPRIAALVPIDIVHVTFDDIKDPGVRAFFLGLPTTFSLPATTVTRLRDVAGQLLRENQQFQQTLQALRYVDKPETIRCLGQ